MYLAQTTNSENIKSDFYIKILEDIVNDHDSSAKESVDKAIFEAINIATDTKDVFSINTNSYFLVTKLLQDLKEKLIELNKNTSIPKEFYPEILQILR